MTYSRISRLEEKRTRKQLTLMILGIVVIIILLITVGIPLFVQVSVFLGNLNSRQPIAETSDTTAPFPPTLSALPTATNSASLKVEGYAEAGTTLTLYQNESEAKQILIGTDGEFTLDIDLSSGQNSVYAITKDAAGNESGPSKNYTVVYKKEGPKLEINEPQEGQSFIKNNQITVRGTTDPGSQVRINDRFVSVKDDGTFQFSLNLVDGENTLTIMARDPAGNQTQLERKVTFQP